MEQLKVRTDMKTQLTSTLYGLLSDPVRIRLVLTVLVVCLMVVALLIPAVPAVADGLSGGGSFSPN